MSGTASRTRSGCSTGECCTGESATGSLTEVAKLITGAHRNGPQFFGLRGKRKQEARHGSK